MTNSNLGSTLDSELQNQMQNQEFAKEFERQQFIGEIAQKIYNLRVKTGLTQKAFAEKAHTSQQVIARIENGRDSRMPSIDLLNKIAIAAGKTINLTFA
tara:strand:- start:702 stop:998 length:297 start_codon:yes stop_codon:yes gene_type:complete